MPTRITIHQNGNIEKGDRIVISDGRARSWTFTLFRRWQFTFTWQRVHQVTTATPTTLTIK